MNTRGRRSKVVLDPGHGGKDPGAVGPTGLREKDVALSVALRMYDLLETAGLAVYMTREDDTFLELGDRARVANDLEADVFVSFHCNSAKWPAEGLETWIARQTKVSYPLAEAIQDGLTGQFPDLPDRGVKRANFTVLTRTRMAAALPEIGFIHTPAGEARLAREDVQQRTAQGIVWGILRFLGVRDMSLDPDPEEPQPASLESFASIVLAEAQELEALATAALKG